MMKNVTDTLSTDLTDNCILNYGTKVCTCCNVPQSFGTPWGDPVFLFRIFICFLILFILFSIAYALPKLYSKNYYCISCAVHSRIVRVRNVVKRRNRDPPVRFRRTPKEGAAKAA